MRERKGERDREPEKERERNIDVRNSNWEDPACSPGVCADAPTHEAPGELLAVFYNGHLSK